jgi:hypothetical protein
MSHGPLPDRIEPEPEPGENLGVDRRDVRRLIGS